MMSKSVMMPVRWSAIVLIALFTLSSQAADDIPPGVQSALQRTISGQMDAFRMDNGDLAYSFAAPSIKRMFPSADRFMSMVKNGYAPVYRPQAVEFGEAIYDRNRLAQQVFIQGPQGNNWIALYTFEQQAGGDYKITGVFLKPDDSAV